MVQSSSVAAVVVTYHRRAGLIATIEALQRQTHPPTAIVVVDNGGDVTLDQLADTTGVLMISPGSNTGAAGGFAIGMQAAVDAGHDWLYLVNDDDRPRPTAIAQLLDVATRAARPTMAMGWVNLSGRLRATGAHLRRGLRYPDVAAEWGGPYFVDVITFGGLLMPADVVMSVGVPRHDFFMMWEEYEFCLRARRQGWQIAVLPEPLVDIDGLPAGGKYGAWRAYYQTRNSIITVREYGDWRDMRWLVLQQTKYLIASLASRDRVERVQMRVHGMLDGTRGRTGRTVEPS